MANIPQSLPDESEWTYNYSGDLQSPNYIDAEGKYGYMVRYEMHDADSSWVSYQWFPLVMPWTFGVAPLVTTVQNSGGVSVSSGTPAIVSPTETVLSQAPYTTANTGIVALTPEQQANQNRLIEQGANVEPIFRDTSQVVVLDKQPVTYNTPVTDSQIAAAKQPTQNKALLLIGALLSLFLLKGVFK